MPDPHAAPPLALRRGRRVPRGAVREHRRRGDPQRSGTLVRTGDLASAARPDPRLHPDRARRGRQRCWSAATELPMASTRASTSSPRCSSTSTTRWRSRRRRSSGRCCVVIPYDDDADAVRIANDSDYGLAGYVMSEARSIGRSPSPASSGPAASASTATAAVRRRPALRRLQGRAGSVVRTASPGSTSTSRSSRSPIPRPRPDRPVDAAGSPPHRPRDDQAETDSGES